jgi:hypothetical protein
VRSLLGGACIVTYDNTPQHDWERHSEFFMDLFALEGKGLLRIYHDETGTMRFEPTTECPNCDLDRVENDLLCETGSPYCVLCCECCDPDEEDIDYV